MECYEKNARFCLLQANDTAHMLRNSSFDVIFCSPLKRAKQTAEIINKNRGLIIIYDDRLRERNYGEFEGTNKSSFDYNEF